MRLILLAFCTLALSAQTKINDPTAAGKLLGPHNMTLQWLIFELKQKPGTVTVSDENGRYKLRGDQRGKGADFITIDGEVLEINALNFTFKGKIVSRVSHIADGKECTRDGTFQFRIAGARQFWRLRENQNPCDQVVDYIDIFFARPTKN